MGKLSFYLGLAGPVLFLILSSLAEKLTPNFNSTTEAASNLASTQYGWLQNGAFIAGGLGFILLGGSIYQSIRQKTKIAPLLICLFGIFLALEAVFESNPEQTDTSTIIHIALFALGILGMIVSIFRFGWVFKKISSLLSIYSLLTGLVALVGFAGIFATQGSIGLWQQATVFPIFLWAEVAGIYSLRKVQA